MLKITKQTLDAAIEEASRHLSMQSMYMRGAQSLAPAVILLADELSGN